MTRDMWIVLVGAFIGSVFIDVVTSASLGLHNLLIPVVIVVVLDILGGLFD